MRAKSVVLLVLALGCGLVASYGITQALAHRDAATGDPTEKQEIMVAAKDILMGEQVTAQMVSLDSRPAAYVPVGAFATPDDVVGRRAKTLIPAGTPITDALLLAKGVGEQMASSGIPPGKRLATVKVEAQSAAGNLIRPGDWVDVLVHVRADQGRGILKTATKTILQNIRVYAVNDMWDISSTSGEKSLTAKTISLIVSPEQAELVSLAVSLGNVSLVMRGPDDKEIKLLAGADTRELLGLSAASEPPAPSPTPQSVLKDLIVPKPVPPEPAPATAVAPPEEPRTFTMRILGNGEVTEVVFEASGNSDANSPDGSPTWRVNPEKSKSWKTPAGASPAAEASNPLPAVQDTPPEAPKPVAAPVKSKHAA